MTPDQLAACRRILSTGSKSFTLASKLLHPEVRDDATVVYAWCRSADDAVDLVPALEQPRALGAVLADLDRVYGDETLSGPVLGAFQEVVRRRAIPRAYPDDLLAGMQMDAVGTQYESLERLLLYCYRVAGTVGLMMCHVLGVREARAVRHAAHLGIAMQLTNICRDVLEDWERGRLYIPDSILEECGAPRLRQGLGAPLPSSVRDPVGRAVCRLLDEADRFYASGDQGLSLLSWRSALAVRTARSVYSSIGTRIREQGYDVFAGRAYVPGSTKLRLVIRALSEAGAEAPVRLRLRQEYLPTPISSVMRFPTDVLPI